MELRTKLKELRTDTGMTRAKFAEASGLSPHTIRAYEKGTRSPSNESLLSILKAAKVAPDVRQQIAMMFMLNDRIAKSDPVVFE